ncbi:MAG: S-adenosylmethionine:tRNA ribosyltransferase-isomerase [Chloroflexia bacterium]|jgi:S-adenosylmethionine:tRNA ribosyltransferase-isomerase|nr:S-adenosylmethionine:tRNA ribosyltransferase-isomerase [Chloroflexia bacterium]
MRIEEFDYSLPPELIAQTPVEPRDHARLLILDCGTGSIEHRRFYELADYLSPGDLLVANESKVLPARLMGYKVGTGGKVEVLLLRPAPQPEEEGAERATWEALVSPGRRVLEGTRLGFGNPDGGPYLEATVVARAELGGRIVRFDRPPRPLLDALGQMPLPPYIHEKLDDPSRYQTVYARTEGSAAAPTAGLHFTQRLIGELKGKGVGFATVVLHVGLDTFRPVHEENVEEHPMHSEWYSLPRETAEAITRTRAEGGRVVAVGTTSVRVLETVAQAQSIEAGNRTQQIMAGEGWSRLYIRPGYRFGLVDAMITNFHLPRTTLLMLVSAFAGRELMLRAYDEAIKEKYRFYSFGDAMLLK